MYIKKKYNLDEVYTINPYFEIDTKEVVFLFLQENEQSLTVLYEPYKSDHLLKYFISIDNGLKYNLTWTKVKMGKLSRFSCRSCFNDSHWFCNGWWIGMDDNRVCLFSRR